MTATYFNDVACDALVPVAQKLVGAVRDDQPGELLEAVHAAQKIGGDNWRLAIIITLAAMVPDDVSPRRLLAWMDHNPL